MTLTPYSLTITDDDASAIAFSGGCYSWSDTLLGLGICSQGTHKLEEFEAREVVESIWADDGAFCPLLAEDSNLARELIRLEGEVV